MLFEANICLLCNLETRGNHSTVGIRCWGPLCLKVKAIKDDGSKDKILFQLAISIQATNIKVVQYSGYDLCLETVRCLGYERPTVRRYLYFPDTRYGI